jgi:tetratricopeptide (TPR) repeat protein
VNTSKPFFSSPASLRITMAAGNSSIADEDFWKDLPLFAPDGVNIPVIPANQSAENMSDALGALSHLLYDDETPQEIAEDLREQGNTMFKHNTVEAFRRAMGKYTEAINLKGDTDPDVTAAAYSNRAAAHLKLGNVGKALQDAEAALVLQKTNVKCRYRAAVAANKLEKFDKAAAHCAAALATLHALGLAKSADAAAMAGEKMKAAVGLELQAAAREAQKLADEAEAAATSEMARALEKRRVKMGLPLFSQQRSYTATDPVFDEQGGSAGDTGDRLVLWPVLVVYPEVSGTSIGEQSDYLKQVSEDATMDDLVATLFPDDAPPPPWDVSGAYGVAPDRLAAEYRVRWTMPVEEADSDDERDFVGSTFGPDDVGPWKRVSRSTTIAQLIARQDYIVPKFPVIYLIPK